MTETPATTVASSSDPRRPSRVPMAAHLILLCGATIAIFLAGGPPDGNLGAFLVVAGVALVGCPPQIAVERKVWMLGAGLLLAASLALLPHGWFPEPAWRSRLLAAGVPLGPSVTPMPEETWFWLAVMSVAVGIALLGLAQPIRSRPLLSLAVTAIAICAGYAAFALFVHKTGWEYPFDPDPADFGFFLNRNHTSAFLVTGCMIALGVLGVAARGRHWIAGAVAAAGLAMCSTSLIFFTTSRGGMLALACGTLLWVAGLGAANRSKPLLISFAAVFVATGVLFLSSQSVARHRLLTMAGVEKERAPATAIKAPADAAAMPLDTRLLILADTLHMIRDAPLTGAGLGSFRWVFRLYRERHLSEAPISHPESDWLMLAAEAGPLALLVLMAAVGLLLRDVWPLRSHPYWPLRWGFLCAALAVLLHGFVDVPAHRAALGWWVLVLAALGFQTSPRETRRAPRSQHALFVLTGLGALALGAQLLRAQWFGGPPSPPSAPHQAQAEIIGLRFEEKTQEAIAVARAGIRRWPLADRLYFQLAVSLFDLGGHEAEVDATLQTQRLLNPVSPELVVEQGELWLETDPARAGALFLEAVKLTELTERRQHLDGIATRAIFTELLGRARKSPELQRLLLAGAGRQPELLFTWFERVDPTLAVAELPRLAADPTFTTSLTNTQRRRFLDIWYTRGDRESLWPFLADRPEWQPVAWPVQMRRLVDAGKFQEATTEAARLHGIDLTLPPVDLASITFSAVEPADPVAAFDAAWRRGNTVSARRILDEARKSAAQSPDIWRLSAAEAAHEGRWPNAWNYLDRHLQAAGLYTKP